ncbi:MAG: helix-turn-helix transcriptional regulator, partial [Treponema sp.]|nr:helix-turn-helix transcriptional regulator [Treponema sp.]
KEILTDELNYQGLSYKTFAERVGISINTLNMYIYRNSIPSADIAVKMAQELNTTVEYLVTGIHKAGDSDSKSQSIQISELRNIIDNIPKSVLPDFVNIARSFKNAVSKE